MDDHDVSTQPVAEQLTLKVNLLRQSVESCRASVAAWYPNRPSHAKVHAPAILWTGAIMSSLAHLLHQQASVPAAVAPTPDQVLAAMIENRGQVPADMKAPSLADTFGRYTKESNLVVAGHGVEGVTSRPRRMPEALSLAELRLTTACKVGQ
ncbi:hypothetical protein GGF32_000098 [Allomyces javanicus]|nr:hypothetical protein GGF32_000098 [Allomyces javanicus]